MFNNMLNNKYLNGILITNLIGFVITAIVMAIIGTASSSCNVIESTNIFKDLFYLKRDIMMMLITPWSLITYSFLHAGFMHFIMNMIFFFFTSMMFCNIIEDDRKLLSFYLTSSIFAGILIVIFMNIFPMGLYGVGASAVIFALLTAIGIIKPNMEIRLYFFIPIKLKWIVLFFILIQILTLDGSAICHLCGILYGLIFGLYYRKGVYINSFMDKIVDFFAGFIKRKKKVVKQTHHRNGVKIEKPLSMDDILDKINDSGMKSLTKREIDYLKRNKS